MSFEIYIPSHTDDSGEQEPERVVGTGESEEAAWRTVRRHLCFTAQIHLIARCHVREIARLPVLGHVRPPIYQCPSVRVVAA